MERKNAINEKLEKYISLGLTFFECSEGYSYLAQHDTDSLTAKNKQHDINALASANLVKLVEFLELHPN